MKTTPRVFAAPRRIVIGLTLALALLLTACGAESDSWAGLSGSLEGDAVYVAYDNKIVAVDARSGDEIWAYPPKDDRDAKFYAEPTVYNGTIYIGDYKGRLHAINSDDGTNRWTFELDDEINIGPLSVNPDDRVMGGAAVNPDLDLVYFGLASHDVVAVSTETAQEVWSFTTEHGVWGAPLYVPADESGHDAALFVVSLDRHIYSLDPETGDKRWSTDLGGAAPGGLTFDPDTYTGYVGTFLSELLAIDLTSGEIVHRFETDDWLWDNPALDDGVLYFGDLKGNLYAVSVDDNGFTLQWKQELAKDAIRAMPLVVDDMIIVGSQDKNIYAVSRDDGERQWSKKTEGEALSNLIAIEQGEGDDATTLAVVSTSEKKELAIAYQAITGEVDWRYDAD